MKVTVSTPGLESPLYVRTLLSWLIIIPVTFSDMDLAARLIIVIMAVGSAFVLAYGLMLSKLTLYVTDALSKELGYASVKVDGKFTRFEASNTSTDTVQYGTLQRLDAGGNLPKQRTFLVTFIG